MSYEATSGHAAARNRKQDWVRAVASLAGVAACGVAGCSSEATDGKADGAEKTESTAAALDTPGTCGALCGGACGKNCDACNLSYRYVCEVDNNRQNTGYKKRIQHYTCGTHAACRQHDTCGNNCAAAAACDWTHGSCFLGCDADIVNQYGASNAWSWWHGGGPFDGSLVFEYDDPPGKTLDTTTCPTPSSGGSSSNGGPPPSCDWGSCQVWNGSSCVCACQYPAWCNGMGGCMGP